MAKIKRIKFLQNYAPYKAGEVAGFVNEKDADFYLKLKKDKKEVAKEVKGAPKDKAVKGATVSK